MLWAYLKIIDHLQSFEIEFDISLSEVKKL